MSTIPFRNQNEQQYVPPLEVEHIVFEKEFDQES